MVEEQLTLDNVDTTTGEVTSVPGVGVVQRLTRVAGELKMVAKDGVNSYHKYNFQSIDDVTNALHPLLAKHGIVMASRIDDYTVGGNGNNRHITATVTYTFYGVDGGALSTQVLAEAADTADKASSKLMTQAFKKVLTQMFTIPTGEADPDSFTPTTDQLHRLEEQKELARKLVKQAGLDDRTLLEACRWASTNVMRRPVATIDQLNGKAIARLLERLKK